MTYLACGPLPLLNRVKQRLSQFNETVIFSPEISATHLKSMQAGDTLLLIASPSASAAQQLAQQAHQLQLHFVEISTFDSPWAVPYGFLLQVAGLAIDLKAASPILDTLAPLPNGWWHVGHAGAAAFLGQLQQYSLLNPLGQESRLPAPELKVSEQLHQNCLAYLESSHDEVFVSCHPDRHQALCASLDAQQSPARQMAQLISLLPHH